MFQSPTTSFSFARENHGALFQGLSLSALGGPQQLSGSDKPTSETLSTMTWRETNDVKPTFQRSHPKTKVLNPKMDENLGR